MADVVAERDNLGRFTGRWLHPNSDELEPRFVPRSPEAHAEGARLVEARWGEDQRGLRWYPADIMTRMYDDAGRPPKNPALDHKGFPSRVLRRYLAGEYEKVTYATAVSLCRVLELDPVDYDL